MVSIRRAERMQARQEARALARAQQTPPRAKPAEAFPVASWGTSPASTAATPSATATPVPRTVDATPVVSSNETPKPASSTKPIDETLSITQGIAGITRFGQLDTNKDNALSRAELTAGVSSSDGWTKYGAGSLLTAFDTLSGLDGKEGISRAEINFGTVKIKPNPQAHG
ncbi:MAG: hypothetical protein IPK79_05895 [Vampirovibrionales bacterium]|nr:hypothetical protein [Vampirovibrionales bacterium]